jgi:hypothetical protein
LVLVSPSGPAFAATFEVVDRDARDEVELA